MKPIEEFLAELISLDIKLLADGDIIRCNAPKGVITPNIKTQIFERKAEIIRFLSNKNNIKEITINLLEEADLDPKIYPQNVTALTLQVNNLLLTGVTGFLGAFLLYELLQRTQSDIYCLVRAESSDLAKNTIQNHLKFYLLWDESFSARIIPIIGDLSQPLLGLTKEQFQRLAHQIDVIYHNGALVNSILPYTAFKAINVLGSQEILRLASLVKVKPVHFISTLSVVQSVNYSKDQVIREENILDCWEKLHNGYAQSKWVAEKIMTIAHSRGIPISIYRPGMITGSSQTGICKHQDLLSTVLKSFIELESAPDLDVMWDITPVDYVSQAIAHLSMQQASLGKVFHLCNPQPLSMTSMIDYIRSFGYTITMAQYDDWRVKLVNFTQHAQENTIRSLPLMFLESFSEEQLQLLHLQYDCQNTLDGLAGSSINCPLPNTELINKYLSYLNLR
ncbi:thioester reductase domain-containing protein [Calothrix sp. PCC 7507]|uniref:thioester reductase domain-containing protein n=1 Tax=Calothrix sp. PCC 7507 TaxID=99598 RepID=UPI00029ED71B|nr:thioester reductase domain-containing protein [Calothrix sp. PCC 7507]AFY33172.1 thioester reductase domain protein [Calothrix sp. PCC 7507]